MPGQLALVALVLAGAAAAPTGQAAPSDGLFQTVIAEIPSAACLTATRFETEIANVRHAFLARYTPTSTFETVQRLIRFGGIGFP